MNAKTQHTDSRESLGIVPKKDSSKSNGEELVQYYPVDDTPFTVAKNNEQWYVLMGKYRLTEALKTKAEATKNAKEMKWMRIMQVIHIMLEDDKNKPKIEVLK